MHTMCMELLTPCMVPGALHRLLRVMDGLYATKHPNTPFACFSSSVHTSVSLFICSSLVPYLTFLNLNYMHAIVYDMPICHAAEQPGCIRLQQGAGWVSANHGWRPTWAN